MVCNSESALEHEQSCSVALLLQGYIHCMKKILEMPVPKEMKTIHPFRKNKLGLPQIQLRAATLKLSPCLPEHRQNFVPALQLRTKGHLLPLIPHASWVGFSKWIQGWFWSPATALHSSSLVIFVMQKSEGMATPLLLLGETQS